jgi:hypothetical protein
MRLSGIVCATAIIFGCLSPAVNAQIGANVTYTSTQLGPSLYQYTFTLNNTGATPIGTLWVGWTPASLTFYPYDLLPSNPSVTSSPAGWAGLTERDGLGGYAIEWYDLGTALDSGNSLTSFTFTSADPPQTLNASSPFFSSYLASTSWVYQGAVQNGSNLSDQGVLVNPSVVQVPEPVAGLLVPIALLGLRRRRPI